MQKNLSRTFRNSVFAVFCSLLVWTQPAIVSAHSSSIWDAMGYWVYFYNCARTGTDFNAVLHCDFDDESWEELGEEMNGDLWLDCVETCSENGEFEDAYLENHVGSSAWCVDVWESYYSAAGVDDSYAHCVCNVFDYCWG
ncbi:MAG: hypothetical protein KA205_04355 [Acidobacteria bacterium]|nr:hypothetical protein [Acidobacteriota bacterium]